MMKLTIEGKEEEDSGVEVSWDLLRGRTCSLIPQHRPIRCHSEAGIRRI